ncbi:peptide-methionine (S)-S-oxide reductase [Exiguobacterium sp. B2(2022)]|uniref:peptide-methionine (S)-S-oxide reductase n=1 Tax=Exiguobacterium sp. B2(2022) TaxID=2992755 RepID=UPI00237B8EA4|nr:peptide-methionine (S)-S-oxide reductase [Exiguobacterium sp. B2(2022)]MDE0562921.1 peptide-methionine (S)-S-oxide reductase [Exiguobacterium sp. B2(2022)]
METIYLAGGCLWGVQEFVKTLPGVLLTEAGRANGTTDTLDGEYDGYAECVKTTFDPDVVTVEDLMHYLFEIIDPYSVNQQGIDVGEKYRTGVPYSVNQQGIDVGEKYRTGVYSEDSRHLMEAQAFIDRRSDAERIAVEVKPLTNYVRSADEHQDRLTRCPDDYCHIPKELLTKYRKDETSPTP